MKELRIEVKQVKGTCGARLKPGDVFYIRGKGRLELPEGYQMCIYALQSVLPFLILKKRETIPGDDDWIPEIVEICCPDPQGVVFEVREIRKNERK